MRTELPTHKRFKNLIGKKFGRLAPFEYIGKIKNRSSWKCKCDCGEIIERQGKVLLSGNTKSCGCLVKENNSLLTHGMTYKPEYITWCSMKTRCTNTNTPKYKSYGARGIKICDRWLNSFENFYYDMGDKPYSSYTIERHDNNGDYKYSNCYWADSTTQARNKRTQHNNKTGVSGVIQKKYGYQVTICSKYVGFYKDFFEACCARKSIENKIYKK